MAEVVIDADVFCVRLKILYEHWEGNKDASWGKANVFTLSMGRPSEDLYYPKTSSLHTWLLGYELADTLIVFTKDVIHVLTSNQKVALMKPLAAPCQARCGVELQLHVRSKEYGPELAAMVARIREAAGEPLVAHLPKDHFEGKFFAAWAEALASSGLACIDAAPAIADVLSAKDDGEVLNVKKAGMLVAKVMKEFVVKQIEDIFDYEKQVPHSKLGELTEACIEEPAKVNVKLRKENVDIAYPAIFQSGGSYDLKVSASNNEDALQEGVILCSLGARYSKYCASVSRTFIINFTPRQEAAYKAALAAQEAAIAALKPGARMSAAYAAAQASLAGSAQPELAGALARNVGFGTGLEFYEKANVLGPKNDRAVRPGMVFIVAIALPGLSDPEVADEKRRNYAIQVADTVAVGKERADVVTGQCSKKPSDVLFMLQDDEEEEEEENGKEAAKAAPPVATAKKLRSDDPNHKSAEAERRARQEELVRRKNEETYRRLTAQQAAGAGGAGAGGRVVSDVVAYKSVEEMPRTRELKLQLDHGRETVLVPLYGALVPFHITMVKAVGYNQDGEHATIRLTFNTGPGFQPTQLHPDAIFLKELAFRCSDLKHASKVQGEIKTMRSRVMQADKERADRATLVKQEALQRSPRPLRLPDVWLNPSFGGKGRKLTGVLEAHVNGFLYTSGKNEKLEIMFRNIKHAFLQPAKNEMVAILHFHLLNPIMVGNKKARDVQVYREVMDAAQTLAGGRRSAYDPDEIEEEQRERERRNQVNREFEAFAKKVADIWDSKFSQLRLEFDVPMRDLGFHGAPHRESVFLMPTANCLVELTTQPFTVVPLADIEIVNLERVGFNLKNFDMAIIFKDFNREVVRVDAIPARALDTIKEWLTSCEIKYYESKMNLMWKPILKNIKEDPEGFFEGGGWDFLDAEKSDDEEEESQQSEDYEPEGAASDAASSSDDSSDDGSVVTSEDDDGDEDEDASGSDEDEDGLSWDELEKKAAQDDRMKTFSDDSGDERSARKRKGGSGGGGGGGGSGYGAAAKRRR